MTIFQELQDLSLKMNEEHSARNARMELEAKTGKPVVSPLNAKDDLLLSNKEGRNKEKGEQ